MKLYLVRHATPVDPCTDAKRPLSGMGMDEIQLVSEKLSADGGVAPGKIYHSGELRAEQTAKIIARALDLEHVVEKARGLMPYDETDGWIDIAESSTADMMLIGHMPFMARLVARLAGGPLPSFQTSQVTCLEKRGPGDWFVEWSLTPGDIL